MDLSVAVLIRVVFKEGVVEDLTVSRHAALGVVPAHEDAADLVVIDEIVSQRDKARGAPGMLARQLDPDVAVMHDILLDEDLSAAVDIDAPRAGVAAARGEVAVVGRVERRVDVENKISPADAVARLIDRWRGSCPFEADEVDPDVVAVADDIIDHCEVRHVAVEDEGLARAEFQVVEFVSRDEHMTKRCGRRAEYGDAVRVTTFESVEAGLDIVNDIVDDLDVARLVFDENADRDEIAHRRF